MVALGGDLRFPDRPKARTMIIECHLSPLLLFVPLALKPQRLKSGHERSAATLISRNHIDREIVVARVERRGAAGATSTSPQLRSQNSSEDIKDDRLGLSRACASMEGKTVLTGANKSMLKPTFS